MSQLCREERRALLELARTAILRVVCRARLPNLSPFSGVLTQPAGAFVTLHHGGRLRGCIGRVEPSESLAETVAQCAIAAALKDPRFRPLQPTEVPELEIEISVLSEPETVEPDAIEIGRHGLIVSRGQQRGVLLPQVAIEYRWTRERFLEEVCAKAGLPEMAWKDPGTLLMVFAAEVFSESEFEMPERLRAL